MPAGLSYALKKAIVPRSTLIARLMSERDKINCLCAPNGFGKTCLSAQFIDMQSVSMPVYWVDCSSPSFKLHLTQHDIARILEEDCPTSSAIVFDSYESVREEDHESLSKLCRRLKRLGWNVLVCCVPESFPFQSKRIGNEACNVLTSSDLTYSDDELTLLRLIAQPSEHSQYVVPTLPSHRVPSLAFQPSGAYEAFIKDHLADGEFDEKTMRAFVIALLGKGRGADIDEVLGYECDPPDRKDVLFHPHIGWSTHHERFDVSDYPLDEVIAAFSPIVAGARAARKGSRKHGRHGYGSFDAPMPMRDPESIALRASEFVLTRGEYMRSAQIVAGLCSIRDCVDWLHRHQWDSFEKAIVTPCSIVFERLHGYVPDSDLEAGHFARKMLLGKRPGRSVPVVQESRLLALSTDARVSDRALCALCAAMIIGGAVIESDCEEDGASTSAEPTRVQSDPLDVARHMIRLHAFSDSFKASVEYQSLFALVFEPPSDTAIRRIQSIDFPDQASPYAIIAALTMQRVSQRCHADGATQKCHQRIAPIVRVAAVLLSNQAKFGTKPQRKVVSPSSHAPFGSRLSTRSIQAHGSLGEPIRKEPDEPRFEVNILGRFSVKANSKRIDPARFGRKKCRALLGMLLLNPSGMSSDKLAHDLWPSSPEKTAKRNLYSLWSILRSALQQGQKEMSPLIRENGMCRIDRGRISCDVYRVWDISRQLMDPSIDAASASHMLDLLCKLYVGEILPGLTEVDELNSERDALKQRISRVLISASLRFASADYVSLALSCAQFALDVDSTKEDAYETVMALQVMCGQRPQATRTWNVYNEYIDNALGLDPSTLSQEVHRCMLEGDAYQARRLLLGNTLETVVPNERRRGQATKIHDDAPSYGGAD